MYPPWIYIFKLYPHLSLHKPFYTLEILFKECPVEADIVIGVPDSGTPAALGYSKVSSIPYTLGLIKNNFI